MKHIDLVIRDAVQVVSEESLRSRLTSGKRLKIKLGADPSRPDLHLGHTVILRRLKLLQDMGHEIIFVIGDFTGMIGDPSGKSLTRPSLSLEETRASGKTYFDQVSKILDPSKTTIRYNNDWLGSMTFADVIALAGKYTLARMLERDDFSNRFQNRQPLFMHELLYPLAQGYDSVALEADIEVGGTDQTFNLLVGRELQRNYGQTPQEVMTFPLLLGLDGKEKMSKSLGNYIGIDEPAEIMYEKAMRIPDGLLRTYFALTTDVDPSVAERWIDEDIVEAHRRYASEIVLLYHDEAALDSASRRYAEIASGMIPEQIEEVNLRGIFPGNRATATALARQLGYAASNSDARRLIQGGGLKIDGRTLADPFQEIELSDGLVASKGKSLFKKLSI